MHEVNLSQRVYIGGRVALGLGLDFGVSGLVSLPRYNAKGNELRPGQYLDRGEALVTKNGGVLFMQPEGNLVLYGPNGKGQFTALWWTAAHNTTATRATMMPDGNLVLTDPSGQKLYQSNDAKPAGPAARITFQDDGNLVWYDKNGKAVLSSQTNGWHINPGLGPHGNIFSDVAHAVSKIPVVGDVAHIVGEVWTAPVHLATAIASGERLDHALVDNFKEQLKIVKDVAPYAQTVVSLVPGIGTGVAAAIGAGAALAEGQSITQAAKAAIRGAIPGGAIAQAGFDAATKIASGENVLKASLESARNLLPSDVAKKAFDIGLAVATGEKIQTALANGIMGLAPGQLQSVMAAGVNALKSTPGLAEAIKSVAPGAATEGFNLAAGLLSHTGVNETSLNAVRSKLPPEVVQGFDAALKTQVPHIAWLQNVVNNPVAAPASKPAPKVPSMPAPKPFVPTKPASATTAPAQKVAAAANAALAPTSTLVPSRAPSQYAPYPQGSGAVHGALGGAPMPPYGVLSGPPPTCRMLGAPIANMDRGMHNAGIAAVKGSGGRPRMVHGPDGKDYHFSINRDGALIARQCHT